MSWNYRIVRHIDQDENAWFSVHEVYYDKSGEIDKWAPDAHTAGGDTHDDLRGELSLMAKALDRPCLAVEDLPGG